MTAVTALGRMRLMGFLRTGRVLPSLLAALVVLGILYGGSKAQAAEAYGFSAVALFPVLAWQVKLVLDTEPDVQRRLAITAVGLRRELAAGLVSAATVGLSTVVFALVAPWLVGAIEGPRTAGDLPISEGITLGAWAHLAALVAAVGLGAVASRAVTRNTLYGVAVLVAGSVLAIVVGLLHSLAAWIAPPLVAAARTLAGHPSAGNVVVISIDALLWAALVTVVYARLRHTRR